jgi:hypothetical protein
MLSPDNLESAVLDQRFQVAAAEVNERSRGIDAAPVLAEQQELPASGIRGLHNDPPIRVQLFARLLKTRGRGFHAFEQADHCNGGAASRLSRSRGDDLKSLSGESATERFTIGAEVQNRAGRPGRFESAQHEVQIVTESGATARPFESIGCRFSVWPGIWSVAAADGARWPGAKPYQAAVPAFDDLVAFTRGAVQPVGGFKEQL